MANTYTWTLPAGTAGTGGTASDWSPSGPPGSGDTAIVNNGGTILLPDAMFQDNTLVLGNGEVSFSGDDTISVGNPTFDQATTLTTNTGTTPAVHGTILAAGNFISFGTIEADAAAGGTLTIAISNYVTNGATYAGSFQNDGYMLVTTGNTLTISASGTNAGFADAGTLDVEGGKAVISAAQISPDMQLNSANASYVIGQGGSLEIAQSSTSTYTDIAFNGAGTLKLDNPAGFVGDIRNFGTSDTIDLGVVAIASVVFDGQGDAYLLNSGGGTIFAVSVNGQNGGNDGPLDGYGNAGTFAIGSSGGTAAYLNITEGGGADAILTGLPFPGPSVWKWLNNASASAETSADWQVVSGPGNAFNKPSQPGDQVINPGGTILFGGNVNLNNNTLHVGGTSVAAALVMNGDTNNTSFNPSAGNPSLDQTSVIDSAVPGNTTAETTQIYANGYMINEGSILADGPAGSQFSLIIAAGTVTNYPSGTAVTSYQPGYFFTPARSRRPRATR
jgi:hypothetical protein